MDSTVRDLARSFSWRRQRLDRTSRGVEDCLRSVVGVYSANPHGPLALLARVPRLMKGAAVEGVIVTKRAIRVPAMRRSIWMLPTDVAHLAFAATQGKDTPYKWLLARSAISETSYERLKSQIVQTATRPMTPAEIRESLERAPRDLGPVMQAACAEGVLLRIKSTSIRGNDLTYCSTEAWLGEPLREADAQEALVWLAGDYLSAYAPAAAEDFAWWAGVGRRAADEALRAHDPIDVGGGLMLHRRDERAFSGTRPQLGRVNLLPKWDPYTMGYARESRQRFAKTTVLPRIYDAAGDALPVVLVEGSAQGTWGFRFARNRMTLKMEMFDTPGPRLAAALDAEAELVGQFLESEGVTVERVKAPPRASASRAPAKDTAVARKSARARATSRSRPANRAK